MSSSEAALRFETAEAGLEEIEIRLLLEGMRLLCANVLIYFRPSLQERAHRLFYDSLVRSGFLALGKGESLVFSPDSSRYEQVRDGLSLFRKVR